MKCINYMHREIPGVVILCEFCYFGLAQYPEPGVSLMFAFGRVQKCGSLQLAGQMFSVCLESNA